MSRDGWTLRSALWFVFLVALGLKAATGTWYNIKRGSVEYHRQLADGCHWMSVSERRFSAFLEDELSSQPTSDPASSAELRTQAMWNAQSARWHSLLAASLSEKAELCERSSLEWIFWQYDTSRNPPSLPVRHVTGARPPWLENATLAALFRHPIMATLARVDFFWLACLVVAIVGRRLARARGVGGPPTRLDLAPN